jgi:hypothetical protein
MDLGEESLELRLERLFLGSLVELAEEMTARLERVEGECQSRHAQIL